MKKILVWMLCAVMLVSLAACGNAASDNKDSDAQGGTGGIVGTPVPTQKPAETAATQKPAETNVTPKPAETDANPEPAGTDGGDQGTSTGKNKIEDFLSGITLVEIPDVFDTYWDFTGGCVNGKELEADEVAAIKKEKTYVMFYFPGGTSALMEWGGGNSIWGEYGIKSDGYTMNFTMNDNEKTVRYEAVFTNVDDKLVMILFLDENTETVLYFTQNTNVG